MQMLSVDVVDALDGSLSGGLRALSCLDKAFPLWAHHSQISNLATYPNHLKSLCRFTENTLKTNYAIFTYLQCNAYFMMIFPGQI